jgi:hypothetical protein
MVRKLEGNIRKYAGGRRIEGQGRCGGWGQCIGYFSVASI